MADSVNPEHSPAPVIHSMNSSRLNISKMLIAFAIATVIAVGLGVGLGVGLHKLQGRSTSSPKPLTTQVLTNASTASTISGPMTSPTAPVPLLKHRLLDNTSIAATAFNNGNRWIFFQDVTGVVRHATFSTKAGFWQLSAKTGDIDGAKNNTPLAAINLDRTSDVKIRNLSGPWLIH